MSNQERIVTNEWGYWEQGDQHLSTCFGSYLASKNIPCVLIPQRLQRPRSRSSMGGVHSTSRKFWYLTVGSCLSRWTKLWMWQREFKLHLEIVETRTDKCVLEKSCVFLPSPEIYRESRGVITRTTPLSETVNTLELLIVGFFKIAPGELFRRIFTVINLIHNAKF